MTLHDRGLYRLIDRSPIGVVCCDHAGRLRYANPALVRLLGHDSADELLASSSELCVEPGELARLVARHRPDGALDGEIVRWRTKQGRELTVRLYGHVVDEPGGARLDASVVDVSEPASAKLELAHQREALATTETTLDLVVGQMAAMYWIVDRDLTVRKNGGAIRELLGFEPELLLGKTLDEIQRSDPSTTDPIAMHRRALAGETVTYAAEFRNKHLVTTLCPHRRGDAIVGAIGTCIDVTTHHMLERRMVDAQRAESLGVLAGGLAHDFNNLLVAILGNADLALRELGPRAPGRLPLENIRQASLRAAELIDQLLAYSGHRGVASTRVPVGPLVDELLRISAPTMPANLGVRVDLARDLAMRGDASQIRQVMLNLVSNAREALSPQGGTIAIAGRLVHHGGIAAPDDVLTAAAGTYVELEVADDGPGMTRELRRRIFEPFFTTKPTGHGLGLAAVVGIVRAHGGGLRLITAPGAGARFQLLWPSTSTPVEIAAVLPPTSAATVLVVDDEELVRDVVARMIEDLGYAALTANDGPDALAIVERRSVDAVLVDLTLPRMTGADVISALRERCPGLPIILCSGFDRDARAVRADAYLAKPFRIDTLDHTLAKLLPR